MFKQNEYFEGKVASMALEGAEGKATIGIMAAGDYEFSTSMFEIMTVMAGEMLVKKPGATEFVSYKKFESFTIEKDSKFNVKVAQDTPYMCVYK